MGRGVGNWCFGGISFTKVHLPRQAQDAASSPPLYLKNLRIRQTLLHAHMLSLVLSTALLQFHVAQAANAKVKTTMQNKLKAAEPRLRLSSNHQTSIGYQALVSELETL